MIDKADKPVMVACLLAAVFLIVFLLMGY